MLEALAESQHCARLPPCGWALTVPSGAIVPCAAVSALPSLRGEKKSQIRTKCIECDASEIAGLSSAHSEDMTRLLSK